MTCNLSECTSYWIDHMFQGCRVTEAWSPASIRQRQHERCTAHQTEEIIQDSSRQVSMRLRHLRFCLRHGMCGCCLLIRGTLVCVGWSKHRHCVCFINPRKICFLSMTSIAKGAWVMLHRGFRVLAYIAKHLRGTWGASNTGHLPSIHNEDFHRRRPHSPRILRCCSAR